MLIKTEAKKVLSISVLFVSAVTNPPSPFSCGPTFSSFVLLLPSQGEQILWYLLPVSTPAELLLSLCHPWPGQLQQSLSVLCSCFCHLHLFFFHQSSAQVPYLVKPVLWHVYLFSWVLECTTLYSYYSTIYSKWVIFLELLCLAELPPTGSQPPLPSISHSSLLSPGVCSLFIAYLTPLGTLSITVLWSIQTRLPSL